MNANEKLKLQIELLGNNIQTIKVPYNYLKEQKIELEDIKDSVQRLEEKLNYSIRGVEIVEEGFQQVYIDLTNLINE